MEIYKESMVEWETRVKRMTLKELIEEDKEQMLNIQLLISKGC